MAYHQFGRNEYQQSQVQSDHASEVDPVHAAVYPNNRQPYGYTQTHHSSEYGQSPANVRFTRPHAQWHRGMSAHRGYYEANRSYGYGPIQSRPQFYPQNYYHPQPSARPAYWNRGPRMHHQNQPRHVQRPERHQRPNTSKNPPTVLQNRNSVAQKTDSPSVAITPEIITVSTSTTQSEVKDAVVMQPTPSGAEGEPVKVEAEPQVVSTNQVTVTVNEQNRATATLRQPAGPPNRITLSFSNAPTSELARLCEVERTQLKRRFRLGESLFIENEPESGTENEKKTTEGDTVANLNSQQEKYTVIVSASDPDWPFDMRTVTLTIHFPVGYPREPMQIGIAKEQRSISSSAKKLAETNELVFPDVLRRTMQQRIDGFVQETWSSMIAEDRLDLPFRTFLRWFDRSLLDMFIAGLRTQRLVLNAQAAGISVAHGGKWRAKSDIQERRVSESTEKNKNELEAKLGQLELTESSRRPNAESNSETGEQTSGSDYETESDEEPQPTNDADANGAGAKSDPNGLTANGVEVELTHFEMREQAASLRCTLVCIEFACVRCRTAVTLQVTCAANRPSSFKLEGVSKKCIRCRSDLTTSYSSAIAHSSSNVVGRLTNIANLTPNDLLVGQSRFEVQCLACGHNTALTEPKYGMNEARCMKCFAQLRVSFDSTRFYAVNTGGRQLIARSNLRRVTLSDSMLQPGHEDKKKEPRRTVGTPLPDYGTCRHYAKSFRWFRFSCCGKLYPCDECHREAEKSHEEELASRMVCGFCSAEQPINPRAVCTHCLSDLRRGGSSSAHWEGGAGCRDVLKMARNDRKKFSNQNKTESKHAVHVRELQTRQGRNAPKDTKLRHAAEQS